MRWGRKSRGYRAAGAAIAALVALFAQALIPAAALAAESLGARSLEICTDQGAQIVAVGADGEARESGFAGLPCHDCLAATVAVVVPPEPAVAPVVYVAAEVRRTALPTSIDARARAPPRPPGQGPPFRNA